MCKLCFCTGDVMSEYIFSRVVRVCRSISLFHNSQRHKQFHIIHYHKTYYITQAVLKHGGNVNMCYKRLCLHYTILTAFMQCIFTHNSTIYHYFWFVIIIMLWKCYIQFQCCHYFFSVTITKSPKGLVMIRHTF